MLGVSNLGKAVNPAAAAAPVQAPASAGLPASAIPAGDAFTRSNATINVLSFNTAGDGCRHTPENEIPDAQPFQQVIKGEPGAPIIACQETTPLLGKTLQNIAKTNPNVQVVWPGGHTWLPGFLGSTLGQGNLVVIPKRYKIESVQTHTYAGRLGNFVNAVQDFLFHHKPANNILLALQKRGYESIALRDTQTGKQFTVIATHVAWNPTQRSQEAPQLAAAIKAAKAKGPVTVLGDFNTPSQATNYSKDQNVTQFWNTLDATGIQDVGDTDHTVGNQDIDHVLQTGFGVAGDDLLNGSKLTIPGRTDAGQVSDHYGHEAGLTLN